MKKTFRLIGLTMMALVLSLGVISCGDDDDPVEQPVTTPAVGEYVHNGDKYDIVSADIDYINYPKGHVSMRFYDKSKNTLVSLWLQRSDLNKTIDLSKKMGGKYSETWSITSGEEFSKKPDIDGITDGKQASEGTLTVKSFEGDIFHVTYNFKVDGKTYSLTCKGKFDALVY